MERKRIAEIIEENFNQVFYIAIIFLVIILTLTFWVSYRHMYTNRYNNIRNTMEYFVENINNDLSELEHNYNQILSNKLEDFYDGYNSYDDQTYINLFMNQLSTELTEIETENVKILDVNYYFINQEGEVFKTDYEPDIGFDLSETAMWEPISNLESGEIKLDPLVGETQTNKFRLYSYLRLPDDNIFEIGILFDDDLINIFSENLSKLINSQVQNLAIFDYGYDYFLGSEMKLDQSDIDLLEESIATGDIISSFNFPFSESFYYGWETDFNQNRYLKLEINHTFLVYVLSFYILITLLFIITIIYLRKKLSKSFQQKVVSPLEKISDSLKRFNISNEKNLDLDDYKIFEIDMIKEEYLDMTREVKASYQQLKAYNDEITELNEQLRYRAYHDPLTDLPNRTQFINYLQSELDANKTGAVILLDLDNFKEINDTLGHIYGDKILVEIGKRLNELAATESIFSARFGGDEFLLLLKNINDRKIIIENIKLIKNKLSEPYLIDGDELKIDFTMGVTIYPEQANNTYDLITNADTAMYQAKALVNKNMTFYDSIMKETVKEKKEIKDILNKAILNNRFELYYQPQVNLKTGKSDVYEGLLRLKDHNISPGIFIPVAEEYNLIKDIGRIVTKKAIEQIKSWQDKGLTNKIISINFSAKQLHDSNYIDFLINELNDKGIDPKMLEIEITESILLEETRKSREFLEDLKAIGIRISLDDFGSGYSSLRDILFFKLDKVKLDKSIGELLIEEDYSGAMIGLISMLKSLELEIVAEGIEEIDQYKKLIDQECDYIQGYLFSKPLPVSEIEDDFDLNYFDTL